MLSLCPFGALLSGAASVAAGALNKADELHRTAIATHIAESMTLVEFNRVSNDVALALTDAFSEQLDLLVAASALDNVVASSKFLAFFKVLSFLGFTHTRTRIFVNSSCSC